MIELAAVAALIGRALPGAWSLQQCEPIAGGMSARMWRLRVRDDAGVEQLLVLRQPGALFNVAAVANADAAQREATVLNALRAVSIPVPRCLHAGHDAALGACLLLSYVDGANDFGATQSSTRTIAAATTLARIHGVAVSVPRRDALPLQLPARFNLDWPEARALADALARIASEGIAAHRNPVCLLHGDYWPGNLLWHGDTLAAVIDWEDACIGEPLSDLAIARLDVRMLHGGEAMQLFTRAYLDTYPLDVRMLPVWDLHAAARVLRLAEGDLDAWAGWFHDPARPDLTGDAYRQTIRAFVGDAITGVDAIAARP